MTATSATTLTAIPDPRSFRPAAEAPAVARKWYELAEAELGAHTAALADEAAAALRGSLAAAMYADAPSIADAIDHAPTPVIARTLWRELDAAYLASGAGECLAATAFALPLVLVAAMQQPDAQAIVPCVLANAPAIVELLRAGKVLRGSENFALANALVGPSALSIAALPEWLALQSGGRDVAAGEHFTPAPLRISGTEEGVHLRFLCGRALHAPGVDLLHGSRVGSWGMPLTRAMAGELAAPPLSVLTLPRPPARPLPALHQGLAAQREVAAQLFASNAIRRLRAVVGEPQAVISAHVAPDAPGGGELRLSLSSPFAPRDAEGFRCALHPIERAADVAAMLIELMHDCRVSDVRVIAGVHPDRVPGTAMPLLYKPETIPGGAEGLLQ